MINKTSKVSDIPRRYKAVWKDDRKAPKMPIIGFTRKEAFALAWVTGRTLKRVNGRWIVGGITL